MSSRRNAGFTLIEVITVIVLIGALAALGGVFIAGPFQAVDDMRRRAGLVDEAQLVIDRIAREVRTALPNSVRIGGGGTALEFVSTLDGGRYRRRQAPGGTGEPLNRTQSSDTFDVLGGLPEIDNVSTGAAGTACADGNGDCISIYNTGQTDFNVYDRDNIARITGTTAVADTATTHDQITYDNGGTTPAFRQHSPAQRFFVIDGVVSFICGGGNMNRHSDYGLNATQDTSPGGTVGLMASDIANCDFTYTQGTSSRAGLVTIDITITRDNETVRLLQQAHVMNAP